MKLVLGDSEYDVWDSVNYATLGDLDDLQEQSSTDKFEGITDPYIRAAWIGAMEFLIEHPGESLRGRRDFRRALMGIVFLAKRRGGEPGLSFAEVRAIPYHEAKLRFEEKELEAADAPKDSGADGSAPPE